MNQRFILVSQNVYIWDESGRKGVYVYEGLVQTSLPTLSNLTT